MIKNLIKPTDQFICIYCQQLASKAEREHLIPKSILKSKYGLPASWREDLNMLLSCHNCNQAKKNIVLFDEASWKEFESNRQMKFSIQTKYLISQLLVRAFQQLSLDQSRVCIK